MNTAKKVIKDKKSICLLEDGQAEHCLPVQDLHLPLCENHKRELNKLTSCKIADYIRSNFMERDDESLVFNQKNGSVYSLNSTGTFIFKEILAGKTFCEILVKSTAVFEAADIAELTDHYRRFIEELQKSDLIRAVHDK